MTTAQLELRVGALVVGAAVLLVSFVLVLGHVRLSKGFVVRADFAYAGALQSGASVKLSGVSVGQVTSLGLVGPNDVPPPAAPVAQTGRQAVPMLRATLSLNAQARDLLHADGTFAVATQGVIGESYLELLPGKASAPIGDEMAVRGLDAPRLYEMTLQVAALLGSLGQGGGGNSADVAAQAGQLLSTLNGVLGERQATLAQSIDDAAAATRALAGLSVALRRGLGEGREVSGLLQNSEAASAALKADLPGLLERGGRATAAIDALARKADGSFDAAQVSQMMVDARKSMDELQAAVQGLQRTVQFVGRGEGTVGGLLQDPQIYDDIKELMRDLKQHPWKILWKD